MNPRLTLQLFTMEIRKVFAYRADFWLSFIVASLAQFCVAFFLWKSIFSYKGVDTIGTFTFPALMFYYLLVPVLGRTIYSGNRSDIALEIYEGTLTRYLIYPVSFFRYKLLVHISNASVLLVQLLLVITLVSALFPSLTASYSVTPFTILEGTVTTLAATVLYFIFSAWVQLIAFWADQIWSLSAIIRFITSLLGGSLLPLSLFPESIQPMLSFLPFSYFIHFPLQCFLGNMTAGMWFRGIGIMGGWAAVFTIVYALIWRKGNLEYTGVGI
jgi:ABC-2 type transport system permease protein